MGSVRFEIEAGRTPRRSAVVVANEHVLLPERFWAPSILQILGLEAAVLETCRLSVLTT